MIWFIPTDTHATWYPGWDIGLGIWALAMFACGRSFAGTFVSTLGDEPSPTTVPPASPREE